MKGFIIPPGVLAPALPTPAELQARSKSRLVRSGGRRMPFNLPAQAIADIEAIRSRDGLRTATDAVIAALASYANSR